MRVDPLRQRRVDEGGGDLLRVRVAQPDGVDLVELHPEERRLGDLAALLGAGVAVEQLRSRRPLDLRNNGVGNLVTFGAAVRQKSTLRQLMYSLCSYSAARRGVWVSKCHEAQLVPEIRDTLARSS